MKALSIRQPYAWAITQGFKPVENRSWSTLFRGPVLIHADAREMKDDIDSVIYMCAAQVGISPCRMMEIYRETRVLGAIVGTAGITDCVTRMNSDWFYGPYGFLLRSASPIKPIPYKGRLGFFDVNAEEIEFTDMVPAWLGERKKIG